MEKQPVGSPDPCLLPFLRAREESERTRHLDGLLRDAEPVIQGILRRKGFSSRRLSSAPNLGEQTGEDLHGEVVVRLLTRLNALHTDPAAEAIGRFPAFVAATTYHVYDDHLREKYPQRSSLKRKLVYLLTGRSAQQGFAVWDGEGGRRLCGFAAWQRTSSGPHRTRAYDQFVDDPHRFAAQALPREPVAHMNPADWLAGLFSAVGCPVELNDLIHGVAALWGVKDAPETLSPPGGDEDGRNPVEEIVDPRGNVALEVEQRDYLRRLWSEVRQLPPRQCAALLLNLRDASGCGVIELLELRGIATLREIAAALAMPPEQFAALSNDLPIEDAAIAERLGCTRQQVINLRKVARERLERRARAWGKEA